jgi:ATP-dependent Clp protease ATP-binding subunit ClpC
VFERFSDGARRVVVRSQEHARILGHDHIGTGHLLLGVLDDDQDSVTLVFERLDVEPGALRAAVMAAIGRGDATPSGHVPFTTGAKKTLELSLRAALEIGDRTIRAEHVILGLIQEPEGPAAEILREQGVGLDPARAAVVAIHGGSGRS